MTNSTISALRRLLLANVEFQISKFTVLKDAASKVNVSYEALRKTQGQSVNRAINKIHLGHL